MQLPNTFKIEIFLRGETFGQILCPLRVFMFFLGFGGGLGLTHLDFLFIILQQKKMFKLVGSYLEPDSRIIGFDMIISVFHVLKLGL